MPNLGSALSVGLGAGSAAFPPLAAAGLAVQGVSAIAQAIRAAKQKKLANQINAQRPTLQRTQASQEFENRARTMANSTRLPNQGYYENLLGQQTAQTANKALQTSNSSAEAIAGLTAADRNQREGLNQLAGQGADYRLQSEQNLNNALQMKQGEELEMFDYNKNQPYQTQLLRKQALTDASNRNFEGAIGSTGQLANDALTASMMNKANNGGGVSSGMRVGSQNQETDNSLTINSPMGGTNAGNDSNPFMGPNDEPASSGNLFKKAGIGKKPKPFMKSYNKA